MRYLMKYIILLALSAFISTLTSCKSDEKGDEEEHVEIPAESVKLTAKDVATIKFTEYALSDSGEETTKDWLKFQELFAQIELLKKADLSFFKDDKVILRGFLEDLKNEIPETLNESSIIVRLIAMETTIYKLEGLAIIPNAKTEDLINAVSDVLMAHNNLIFQINKKLEKDNQQIEKPS